MNTTRRDTIKSILAAAAVAAVPTMAAAAVPKTFTKYDSIYLRIIFLLSVIQKRRGFPYDQENDRIEIVIPFDCEATEIRNRFIKAFPVAKYYGHFNAFQNWDCLLVRVNRFVNADSHQQGEDMKWDLMNEVWAWMTPIDDGKSLECRVGSGFSSEITAIIPTATMVG